MKPCSKTRPFLMLGCLMLVALPASILLPGCSGGSSNSNLGTFTSTVTISPSQVGYLTLSTNNNSASGTLRVESSAVNSAGQKSTRAFNFAVANGDYGLTGTFSPPNGFSVSGTFPVNVPFTITGQIPVNGGSGDYTIIANGETIDGNFLTGNFTPTPTGTTPTGTSTSTPVGTSTATPISTSTATPLPTASPTPTRTPAPTPTPTTPTTANNSVENIVFSNISGVNAASIAPYSATLPNNQFFKNGTNGFQGTAFFEKQVGTVKRKLTFEGPVRTTAVSGGEQISVGGGEGSGLANIYYSEVGSNGVEKSWEAQSGKYVIVSANANKVSFSLQNVSFRPAFNANGAVGTFILNGRGSVGK